MCTNYHRPQDSCCSRYVHDKSFFITIPPARDGFVKKNGLFKFGTTCLGSLCARCLNVNIVQFSDVNHAFLEESAVSVCC